MQFEVMRNVSIENRNGEVVPRKAGELIEETEVAAGSIEPCLRCGHIVQFDPPKAAEEGGEKNADQAADNHAADEQPKRRGRKPKAAEEGGEKNADQAADNHAADEQPAIE